MATLTDTEKTTLRRAAARKAAATGTSVHWIKACIQDAGQAIEDILSGASFQNTVSSAIDAASTPYGVTFTVSEKKWLLALVMKLKYERDI